MQDDCAPNDGVWTREFEQVWNDFRLINLAAHHVPAPHVALVAREGRRTSMSSGTTAHEMTACCRSVGLRTQVSPSVHVDRVRSIPRNSFGMHGYRHFTTGGVLNKSNESSDSRSQIGSEELAVRIQHGLSAYFAAQKRQQNR